MAARPFCSVVMVTYQRAHLLRRSAHFYNMSRFPLDRLEVVVVDDGSTDDTRDACDEFDPRIDVKYVRLRKPPGLWRDCAANINVGIGAARGGYILMTHPECCPGYDSLAACVEHGRFWRYSHCKPYYLSPRDQERLDAVPWREEGVLAVRKIPQFYDEDGPGRPDYMPRAIEASPTWRSWVFGGVSRATMRHLGGMIESQRWGSVDLIFDSRRHLLGVNDVTCMDDSTLVLHQNHDDEKVDVPTPRDADAAHAEALEIMTGLTASGQAGLMHPHVDNLGW